MYLQYNDPIRITWRKGDSTDPFVDKSESQKIINNVIVLAEIPDPITHVTITGYVEIYKGTPTSGQFIVNYQNAMVTFNPTEEGKTVSYTYKGRGIIQYPASRIYAHNKNDTSVEQNLQDVIDNSQAGIDALAGVSDAVNKANNLGGKGTYNGSTIYKKNNIVLYSGGTYLCIQDTTAGIDPTNNTYWQFVVSNDWINLINKPTSTVANIDSAVSKRHSQNTDTMLTGVGTNVANTTSSNNIIDFRVNGVTKSSIDNTGKFTGRVDWANVNNAPTSTVANIDDAVSLRHAQNSDTRLNGTGANVINTSGAGNIVDFEVNGLIKSSIDNNGKFSGSIVGNADGNAGTATILETTRTIALTGDITASALGFNGSTNISFTTTLANSGVTAGTYTKITVDAKGRATVGASLVATDIPNLDWAKITTGKPTTRDGYGITDVYLKTDVDTSLATKLNLSGGTLTGFLTLNANPTNPLHAATMQYVDIARQGLDFKDSVRVTTTTDITLSGTQTIDGVALVAGDRVLVKDQTTASQNGIYVVASGAWTRSTDSNTSAKVTSGMYTYVSEGTSNHNTSWVLNTPDPITLDTTALTFAQFSGAGQINAGTGLTKSGSTILMADIGTAGTYKSVTVNAQGQVTAGTNPTTLSGYGITDGVSLNTANTFTGNITAPVFISNVAIGTAPLVVTSTTLVTNLNADKVDGYDFNQSLLTTDSVTFAGITSSRNGAAFSSSSSLGNANFIGNWASLNYYGLGAYSTSGDSSIKIGIANNLGVWQATNPILYVGQYKLIDASGNVFGNTLTSTVAQGTAPLTVTSSTLVNNLNAQYLNGLASSAFVLTAITNETQPSTGLVEGLTWYKSSVDDTQMYLNGAFRSVGGNKPIISTTQPTGTIKEGTVWYNPNSGDVKQYLNGGWRNASGGASALMPYNAQIVLANDATSFTHGILTYNKSLDVIFVYKGGLILTLGIDYTISTDGQTINCVNGTWLKGSIFDILIIASVPSNNTLITTRLENTVAIGVNGTTNVSIGIPTFNTNSDVLDVIVDGVDLVLTQDYTINANGTSVDLVGWTIDSGKKITFRVWKQIRTTTSALDGQLLVDKSIAYSKLGADVIQKDLDIEILAWMGL